MYPASTATYPPPKRCVHKRSSIAIVAATAPCNAPGGIFLTTSPRTSSLCLVFKGDCQYSSAVSRRCATELMITSTYTPALLARYIHSISLMRQVSLATLVCIMGGYPQPASGQQERSAPIWTAHALQAGPFCKYRLLVERRPRSGPVAG